MNSFSKTVLTVAFAALGAASVSSAAVSTMANPVDNFTGFFIGGDAGFVTNHSQDTLTTTGNGYEAINTSIVERSNSVLGGHIGYGYLFKRNIYLGMSGLAYFFPGHTEDQRVDSYRGATYTSTQDTRFGPVFGITAQLGYAVTPNWLPYLSTGWTEVKVKSVYQYSDADDPRFGESHTLNAYDSGFLFGLGIRYAVTSHFLLNAEYDGIWSGTVQKTFPSVVSGDSVNLKKQPQMYMGTLGASYLF